MHSIDVYKRQDPENAFDHPYSNVITRCLGDPTNRSNPDFRSYNLKNDDIFLLCSDGLCGLCHDEEIMQIIEENQNDLVACKDQLIEAALAVGGYDNVTIVPVSYTHLDVYKRQGKWKKQSRSFKAVKKNSSI